MAGMGERVNVEKETKNWTFSHVWEGERERFMLLTRSRTEVEDMNLSSHKRI